MPTEISRMCSIDNTWGTWSGMRQVEVFLEQMCCEAFLLLFMFLLLLHVLCCIWVLSRLVLLVSVVVLRINRRYISVASSPQRRPPWRLFSTWGTAPWSCWPSPPSPWMINSGTTWESSATSRKRHCRWTSCHCDTLKRPPMAISGCSSTVSCS